MFQVILSTKGFKLTSFTHFCNAPTPCSRPEALTALHNCVENISTLRLNGTKEGQNNLQSGGLNTYLQQARKRGVGCRFLFWGLLINFTWRILPNGSFNHTWINNWAELSADPGGCVSDWTTDILRLFRPRPGGFFLQNDKDVTGMDNALCAEYLGHFDGKWTVWIWSPRGYKEPSVSVLQAWMSALSTEILYKFQKSQFGHYILWGHHINRALAE